MCEQAGQSVLDPVAAPPPAHGLAARAGRLRDWLRQNLFLATERGPIGWRKIALAVALAVAGAALSLSRTGGPGALNTIWIEDAKFLLNQGLNQPLFSTLSQPISSYYQVPARILTAIALQFPLTWVPGVMSVFAALEYAMYGLVAYVASGPHLRSPWLRLLVAAPTVMIPLAYTQANNDLVTVQFLGLYGAFWVLLWRPGTRGGKIASVAVMFTVSFTASLSLVLAPLALARLIADRSKTAFSLAVVWFAGILLQFRQALEGHASGHFSHRNSLLWVAERYGARVIPRALFGEKALGGAGADYRGNYAPLHITSMPLHMVLIAGAWAVVVAAIAFGMARLTDANWPLIVTAAIFSVAIFFEELTLNGAVVQPRYTIAPALLCYVALAAALRPRVKPDMERARMLLRWLPATGFAVLLAVAVVLNFRVSNGRSAEQPWPKVVATADAACARPGVAYYHWVDEWWWVSIPCSQFHNYWNEPGGTSGPAS